MIFSPTAKHALRALIYLARCEGDGPVLGRTIAESESIPGQFLSKILHDLRLKGLVNTTKGPGGGYELSRPAADIRILEVVECIDGPIDLEGTCILGLDVCSDEDSCGLHDAWEQFRENFAVQVGKLTLADSARTLALKRLHRGEEF